MDLHPDFLGNDHLRDRLYQHFKQHLANMPPAEPCSIAEHELRRFCERKLRLTMADMNRLWELWSEMACLNEEPLAPVIQGYVCILDSRHTDFYPWADMNDEWLEQTLNRAMLRPEPVWAELLEPGEQGSLSPSSLPRLSQESLSLCDYLSLSSSLSRWDNHSPGNTPPSPSENLVQASRSPMVWPQAANRIELPLMPAFEHR